MYLVKILNADLHPVDVEVSALRCSGGGSSFIFSTAIPIRRLQKCRAAINRRSCDPRNQH